MLKLIVGPKGTGKTKQLIETVNAAAKATKGNVVCVEKGNMLTFNIDSSVKLINIEECHVTGYNELYGFLAGIVSGNYDVTEIFVDGLFKVCERDYVQLEKFFARIAKLAGPHELHFTFTVSAELADLPEAVHKYI